MSLFNQFTTTLNALAPFESRPVLAVAVSGGADSMALALLSHDWAKDRGGHIIALTVDHGLRPESKSEAEQVGAWLSARAIQHHILSWQHETLPTSGIPQAARDARYELLTNWCKSHGALHLLVAHHAYDQSETVALRKERGVKGDALSGMSAITVRSGVRILRPLLDTPPSDLREYLQENNQEWIEDPSNQNLRFARNAMRQQLDDEACKELCLQAKQAGGARSENEKIRADKMARSVALYPEGWAEWDRSEWVDDKPSDTEIFCTLIHTISGSENPVRWDEAVHALSVLRLRAQPAITLGGCYIGWSSDRIRLIIMREQSAIQKAIALEGSGIIWDGRFAISYKNKYPKLRVEALGEQDFLAIKPDISKELLNRIPRKVILTLPAVKALEGVVKVPHINYNNKAYENVDISVQWQPQRPLSQPPFSVSNQ